MMKLVKRRAQGLVLFLATLVLGVPAADGVGGQVGPIALRHQIQGRLLDTDMTFDAANQYLGDPRSTQPFRASEVPPTSKIAAVWPAYCRCSPTAVRSRSSEHLSRLSML